MTTRKASLKNIVSSCVECSARSIDIITAMSIGKGHLNVFISERFIFWDLAICFFLGLSKKCL